MSVNDEIEAQWQALLDTGALVATGISDSGDIEYEFDLAVLKIVNPDLYHAHMDEIDDAMINASVAGLVEIDLTDSEPTYTLTDKGQKFADDIIAAINQT